MRGTRFGSARGVTALRRRTCADRCQFWRKRRRTVLDHRPQRRRQNLDRQLHLGPLPADRRPIVLSRPRHHRAQSQREAPARHRPHLPESRAVSPYERARQHHGRAASPAEEQFHHGISVLVDRRAARRTRTSAQGGGDHRFPRPAAGTQGYRGHAPLRFAQARRARARHGAGFRSQDRGRRSGRGARRSPRQARLSRRRGRGSGRSGRNAGARGDRGMMDYAGRVAQADTYPKLLRLNAQEHGGEIALREKDFGLWRPFTWNDYQSRVRDFALGLVELGIGRGDVIGIIGDNRPDWVSAEIAAHAIGAMSLGLYRDVLDEEAAYLLSYGEARLVFAEDEEQVDKLLTLADRAPHLKHIVYCDPRGMRKYDDPRLMEADKLASLG